MKISYEKLMNTVLSCFQEFYQTVTKLTAGDKLK